MALSNRLVFDPGEIAAAADGGSNVGAYVRAGTDGDLIGSKTIAASEWLQVASALHDGSGNAITSTGGLLDVNIAGINFSYDYNEDDAAASGSTGAYVLAVRQDTLASSTSADGDFASFKVDAAGALYTNGSQYTQPVSATDLDIRDLTHVSDSVKVGDGNDFLAVNGDGSINAVVTATQLDIDNLNATDDAVQAWLFDGTGDAVESINTHLLVADVANAAVSAAATAVSTTAINIFGSPLANRIYAGWSNEGNKTLYWGQSGITVADGFPIHPGAQQVWRLGPAIVPQVIGETGSSAEDLRTIQLS